jgi:hypothetical protein
MAGASVTSPEFGVDPAARPVLDAYIADLAQRLPGSRHARTAILTEIGDGLAETVAKHQARGSCPANAATAAVSEFGDAHRLAAGLATELAGLTARRVGLTLLATGPLVGLIWLAAFVARADGNGWRAQLVALMSDVPVFPILLVLVVPMAVLATTAGGRAARLLPFDPRQAAAVACLAAMGCIVCDVSLMAALVASTARGGDASWLAAVALAVSGVRLTLAAVAARRCTVLRAASA